MANIDSLTIGFRLEGDPKDHGLVRVADFVEFVRRLTACLRDLDHFVAKSHQPTTYYRIRDLHIGSAEVTLEAVPRESNVDLTSAILAEFDRGLETILQADRVDETFDFQVLEAFKGLGEPLQRHVRSIRILRPTRTYSLTSSFENRIDSLLGEAFTSAGTFSGHLDAINVHGVPSFFIYPPLGPTRIRCLFGDSLLPDVRMALKRFVTAMGTLHYHMLSPFPHQIEVQSIEAHPDPGELPTLASIRGMAPRVTGELDSVAFVRRIRDAAQT